MKLLLTKSTNYANIVVIIRNAQEACRRSVGHKQRGDIIELRRRTI